MSPAQMPTQDQDVRNVEWFHIDDFSPGVYDNSFISLAEPKLSAPLGSADAVATFCCAALGQGLGLGPLPALTTSQAYPNAMPGTSTKAFLIGFAVNPGLNNADDELILTFAADDGTNHYQQIWSLDVQANLLNSIKSLTTPTHPGIFGAPYPTWTRLNATGAAGSNPSPELVIPISDDTTFPNGHLYVYPDPAAPGVFGVKDLNAGATSVVGQVICYGSRIICLVGRNYTWPAGTGINTNENVNFTDPPQSTTYGNQIELLTVEEPWGYGGWGTMSVGELNLIKKYGGGVIVYGDIAAPSSVVPMPGVQPTGDIVGRAAPTDIGLVYCSEGMGAWIWNGNNTSQKISRQLRDYFYDATTISAMQGNNYGFYVGTWQNWILFSNNYMYDPDTGAWWVIYPIEANGTGLVPGHAMFWWIAGRFGHQMYAAPIQFGTSGGLNKNWWYRFDNDVPAPHWQWQSLPIHVDKDADRTLDIRHLVVRLSDPSNSGNATATISIPGTSFTATVPNALEGPATIGLDPTPFRLNLGVRGLYDIVIKVNGDNAISGSSPILHSIDVGYEVRAGVPVSN